MKNSILSMSGLAIALDRAKSDIIHVTHAGDDVSQSYAYREERSIMWSH